MKYLLDKGLIRSAFPIICLWFIWELTNHFPNNVLSYDVYGAYLHLPANFIYGDPYLTDWTWIESMNEKYNSTPSYYQFWYADTGRQVVKYPLGFAVIYAPFFFVGHWLAPALGFPQDGFSDPYQWAIIVGHCFYVILGLWFARKVLLHFFSEKMSVLLLFLLFAGTNFFFTSTILVGMPHGHLFLFYALILLYTMRWHEKPSTKNSVVLGSAIGLAALIRATEILVIIIPLLWHVQDRESLKQKWSWVKTHLKSVATVAVVVFLFGTIQLIYYKLTTGHFFIDAYNNAGEGFDFLNPHTIDFLFSARKGWLVYTPLMVFGLFGFWVMYKQREAPFIPLVVFTLVNIYLLSTWTCWWYAESFGQRALVQSYLVLLIPMGYALYFVNQQKLRLKSTLFGVLVLFVAFNQFQTWQMHQGLLHPSRMTQDAYWAHFLKTRATPNFEDLLLVDKSVPASVRMEKHVDQLKIVKSLRFKVHENEWLPIGEFETFEYSGFDIDNSNIFSPELLLPFNELSKQRVVIFKIQAMIHFSGDLDSILPRLVIKMLHNEKPYFDRYLDIEKLGKMEPNTWQNVVFIEYSEEIRNIEKTKLQIFAWLAGQGSFKIDDLRLSVYEGLR